MNAVFTYPPIYVKGLSLRVGKKIGILTNIRMENKFMRVGTGYDIHRLVAGRRLVIGGVSIPYEKGLLGHSDADVLIHAICDALLGAAGLDDIGEHFPDTDPEYKDANSMRLLEKTLDKIRDLAYSIENLDATIFAQAPKMSPHRHLMRQRIADALSLNEDQVNIKATTTEGLGPIGKGKGIAAMCTVLIRRVNPAP